MSQMPGDMTSRIMAARSRMRNMGGLGGLFGGFRPQMLPQMSRFGGGGFRPPPFNPYQRRRMLPQFNPYQRRPMLSQFNPYQRSLMLSQFNPYQRRPMPFMGNRFGPSQFNFLRGDNRGIGALRREFEPMRQPSVAPQSIFDVYQGLGDEDRGAFLKRFGLAKTPMAEPMPQRRDFDSATEFREEMDDYKSGKTERLSMMIPGMPGISKAYKSPPVMPSQVTRPMTPPPPVAQPHVMPPQVVGRPTELPPSPVMQLPVPMPASVMQPPPVQPFMPSPMQSMPQPMPVPTRQAVAPPPLPMLGPRPNRRDYDEEDRAGYRDDLNEWRATQSQPRAPMSTPAVPRTNPQFNIPMGFSNIGSGFSGLRGPR